METNEENLKRKIKVNNIAIIVLLMILLIILCILIFKIVNVKNLKTNNDSNMGIAIQTDKLTFYNNYNKGLIKKEKKDETVLTTDQAYSITYSDGKIYYTTPNNNGGINIKRIDSDGKNEELLVSTQSNSTKMYLQDSKIYYTTSNPDTISKIDIDGKNEEILLQRTTLDFKVVDGIIYFSDIMGFLYSVDTNGENYKTISKESLFNEFQMLDGYVYYFDDENSKLMKMNLKDSAKQEEVTDKLDCDTYNVTSNGIYYLDKVNGKIAYVSLNGNKTKDVITVNTDNTKINILGSTIYYIDSDGSNTVTKVVGTNGKQIK